MKPTMCPQGPSCGQSPLATFQSYLASLPAEPFGKICAWRPRVPHLSLFHSAPAGLLREGQELSLSH